MLGQYGRNVTTFIFKPIVNLLYDKQISPNAVTIFGTTLACIISIVTIPFGFAWQGAILLGIILFSDAIDGMLARKIGINSHYGAFLDSVLDRVSDGIIFACIACYVNFFLEGIIADIIFILILLLIVLSSIVPYVRAKGQVYNAEPKMGLAERTDRLIITLVALGIVDLGFSSWLLLIAILYVDLASIYTIIQRIKYVKNKLA